MHDILVTTGKEINGKKLTIGKYPDSGQRYIILPADYDTIAKIVCNRITNSTIDKQIKEIFGI